MRMISKPLIVAYAVFIDWKPLVGPFERTMIGLDPAVEVLRRPVLDRLFQLALPFQPAQCLRIGTKLIGSSMPAASCA